LSHCFVLFLRINGRRWKGNPWSFENDHGFYQYATPRNGIFPAKSGKIKMIKLEGTIINVFTQQGGKDKKQVKHLPIVTRFNC
jgi:transposase